MGNSKLTPWTDRRLGAVINAVTAMLAGEEGEGDFLCAAEDLEAGLERLQQERARLEKRRRPNSSAQSAPEPK